jgi:hypothetical protein
MIYGRRERTQMLGVTSTVLFFAVDLARLLDCAPGHHKDPLKLSLELDRL